MTVNKNDNTIQDFLKSDRAILIICMGIALIFWVFTNLSQDYDTEIKVKIEFTVPSERILKEPPPTLLNVSINGRGWDLMFRYLGGKPGKLTFNLPIIDSQTISKTDLKKKIKDNLSANISVTEITPESIVLNLDQPSEKLVPLVIRSEIKTIPQYQLIGQIQLLPDEIILSGPQSILANISKATTQKLKISNVNKNNFGEIKVRPFTNSQISFKPQKVRYIANVEQVTEKTLTLPIKRPTPSDTVAISPQHIQMICTVGLSKFDHLKASDFEVRLDTAAITPSPTQFIRVILDKYPSYLKPAHLRYHPQKVKLFRVERNK